MSQQCGREPVDLIELVASIRLFLIEELGCRVATLPKDKVTVMLVECRFGDAAIVVSEADARARKRSSTAGQSDPVIRTTAN